MHACTLRCLYIILGKTCLCISGHTTCVFALGNEKLHSEAMKTLYPIKLECMHQLAVEQPEKLRTVQLHQHQDTAS